MLTIITGPMFSGKTTFLSNILKKNSIYINHTFDTRGKIFYSHNENLEFSKDVVCIKTNELNDELIKDYDIIGIDEAQFFKNIKDIILHWIEDLNKTVYIAGLIGDYKREKFGEINELFCFCDHIHVLHSKCKCGKDAIFSKRKIDKEEQIIIGSDEYEAVCRNCFIKKI